MLEAINLSKNYNGTTALDALNLSVKAGEVFCLLGANGAGKTTTINLFLNFIEPSDGKASINGLDVQREPLETKKYLAYIPEQVNLYKNLSGLENLEYFSALAGQDKYSKEDFLRFFDEVGLQIRQSFEFTGGTFRFGVRLCVFVSASYSRPFLQYFVGGKGRRNFATDDGELSRRFAPLRCWQSSRPLVGDFGFRRRIFAARLCFERG